MSRAGHLSWQSLRALAALCFVAATVQGQAQRVIRGTVVDAREQPVASVAIAAVGGASAISDDSGRFRLDISHRNRLGPGTGTNMTLKGVGVRARGFITPFSGLADVTWSGGWREAHIGQHVDLGLVHHSASFGSSGRRSALSV